MFPHDKRELEWNFDFNQNYLRMVIFEKDVIKGDGFSPWILASVAYKATIEDPDKEHYTAVRIQILRKAEKRGLRESDLAQIEIGEFVPKDQIVFRQPPMDCLRIT